MAGNFLIYGANGFVGDAIARLAVERGLRPILAGRNDQAVAALAAELSLEHRVFALSDTPALDAALGEVSAVLHCAGPYVHTYQPMIEGCLRQGAHYLDITGEMPVFQALADLDGQARQQGIMVMPGVGFDVVPTDCLALYLKEKLPSANRLTLAFSTDGPAGLPPGTARTAIEQMPSGNFIRQDGKLVATKGTQTRKIDFGQGPVTAMRVPWGDVFTAWYSTGIENIEDYIAMPESVIRMARATEFLQPVLRLSVVKSLLRRVVPAGSTPEQREATTVSVWGEVTDEQGRRASARLHGPEAGVVWTALAALAVVERVLVGDVESGFQTPAKVYGADFVLECEGVTREDVTED